MFSYARLIAMQREISDVAFRQEMAKHRDAIYSAASRTAKQAGITGRLNPSEESHAAHLNAVGAEYLSTIPKTHVVDVLLSGNSVDGKREEQIEAGDFSFTHDDSAKSVFDRCGRIGYCSPWDQANVMRYVTVAMALLDNSPGKEQVVLDVGCSTGSFLKFWYENMQRPGKQKLRYTGVEVVKESFEQAALRWGDRDYMRFINADVMKTPIREIQTTPTDAVLLLEVIEHVGQEVAREMLRDSFSVLKPGGILCISSPNPAKHLGQNFVWIDNHLYEFSLEEMKEELTTVGFKIENVSGWYGNLSQLKRAFTPEQEKFYNGLKSLGTSMAGAIMAHLMPEHAKHYTIIARKPN